jgi:hypothetical protein
MGPRDHDCRAWAAAERLDSPRHSGDGAGVMSKMEGLARGYKGEPRSPSAARARRGVMGNGPLCAIRATLAWPRRCLHAWRSRGLALLLRHFRHACSSDTEHPGTLRRLLSLPIISKSNAEHTDRTA